MKIKNSYRMEAVAHLLPVSTFRSRSVAESGVTDISLVVNTCGNRIQIQDTSLSAAERFVQLRHDSVQITANTVQAALMPSTGKPSGDARRDVKGAPRGIPPRSKPKWA